MGTYIIRINGKEYEVEVEKKGTACIPERSTRRPAPRSETTGEEITCGASGKVWKLMQTEGSEVKKGETIMILEAMKMEIPIVAPFDGRVEQILVAEGDSVESGRTVAVIDHDRRATA